VITLKVLKLSSHPRRPLSSLILPGPYPSDPIPANTWPAHSQAPYFQSPSPSVSCQTSSFSDALLRSSHTSWNRLDTGSLKKLAHWIFEHGLNLGLPVILGPPAQNSPLRDFL
jgi:hypothetical protein